MPKLPMHGGMLSPCKVRVDMKEHSGGGFKVTDYLALSKRGEKEKKKRNVHEPNTKTAYLG